MLIRLKGGLLYDPKQHLAGDRRDLFIQDDRIVAPPPSDRTIDLEYDLNDLVVMGGAIDIHTHIAGGKLALARQLMPEQQAGARVGRIVGRSGTGGFLPSAAETGYRYAELGYAACFEPAVLPSNARAAHLEMADVSLVDSGGYVLLGNDPLLFELLAEKAPPARIAEYVSWMVHATQCLGVKVVNPGGIDAFKWNVRQLDLDDEHPRYGVTPRAVVAALTRAVDDLRLGHPLHVHASNLGVPGNWQSTLATIRAAEGRRIHLAHAQFHSYGTEGSHKFSSRAAEIAECINRHPEVSLDVGQIVFGQTVTVSADTMHQFANRKLARPARWCIQDFECEAGCGVVPFRYRDKKFVHALQWAIGLELLLLIRNPWQVLLTTDHPNGGPFTSYPHLIRLLMDRGFRESVLDELPKGIDSVTNLRGISREYSLHEVAVMTRCAPARLLGLSKLGHLGVGGSADIVAYRPQQDRQAMFARPAFVFRRGVRAVRDGQLLENHSLPTACWVARPSLDPATEKWLAPRFAEHHLVRAGNFRISEAEMSEEMGRSLRVQDPWF